MIEKKDVEYLAELSRIDFSDAEILKLQKDLESVLSYVDQIKEIVVSAEQKTKEGPVYNILREDEKPHEEGENREEIINSFPEKDGDYLKVKKILS